MYPKTILITLLLLLAGTCAAQTVETKTPAEKQAELEKEAVAFLRDTAGDVNNLRTLENRISFSSELAGLMWFHDEREARSMFSGVVSDFKALLAGYDAQMNSLGIDLSGSETYGRGFLRGEPTEQARIEQKFRAAMAVRQQIVMSIAEHDPDLAYAFYYDSLMAVSNPEMRKKLEANDSYFEYQLMAQIAQTNAAKAAQFGAKSLEKGLNYQHVELLKKIYAKDADKGIEFASALLSRIKSDKIKPENFWVVSSLLSFGADTLDSSRKANRKKPVMSEADLRTLADLYGQAILDAKSDDEDSGMHGDISDIERFAPGRAAQIKARRGTGSRGSNNSNSYSYKQTRTAVNSAGNAVNSAARMVADAEDREKNEQRMMEDVMKVGTKEMSKEDREKVVSQARKILNATPGRDKKIMGLSVLAAQVAKAGDRELAGEIMRDAQNLVNPNPKNYQDFLYSWMLAGGYAEVDPQKAFPILEDTIGRANETIAAFVKAAEFIDVGEEMIVDNEVQVGAFGGQMIRGLTGELGVASSTIDVLARADFQKTKDLANRFDRPEVRILAKMMVLRAVLREKPATAPLEEQAEPDEGN